MGKIVVCLICTLLCFFSEAQYTYVPMPDSNAHWYELTWMPYASYSYHTYLKDSTVNVNGKTYSILFAKVQPGDEEVATASMIRSDSLKRTFYRQAQQNDTVEEEILNFGLNVGDTIYRKILSNQVAYTLDSIVDIVIGSSIRRKFVFSRTDAVTAKQIWIEGIGSLSGLTWPNNAWSELYTNTLCRFVKNDVIEYNSNHYKCNYLVDVHEIPSLSFKIYPNPSHTSIILEGEALQPHLDLSIYDVIGKEVYHSNIVPYIPIDISPLIPGIYLIAVKDANGKYGWQRMVKQ